MSEIGKYWSVKNRGHLQPAHTVCMLCWSVVPRHFFLWWFRLYKDWQNCYDEKYHFLSTYQGQRQFTGFFCLFPGIWATSVIHDHMWSFSSLCWLSVRTRVSAGIIMHPAPSWRAAHLPPAWSLMAFSESSGLLLLCERFVQPVPSQLTGARPQSISELEYT